MTNEYLWFTIMKIDKDQTKDNRLIINSIDNHFDCYFHHLNGHIHFRITVTNSFFSDREYHISDIYHMSDYDDYIGNEINESKLKEYLVPIIREVKLNSIGV